MDEYIEKDAAIAALTEFRDDQTVSKYVSVENCLVARGAIERATKVLESLPVSDAVPVVRCLDCKHMSVLNCEILYAYCPKTNTVFMPFELDAREHFCSLGERKDGDGNG